MNVKIYSFIVRIWNEAAEPEPAKAVWRGSIEHVGTGRRLYFSNAEAILGFIRERLACDPECSDSTWESFAPWIKDADG